MNNENIDISKLELASNSSRVKAFIIDDLLITFVMLLLLWEPIMQVKDDYLAIAMIMNGAYLQIITIKIIYQSFFIWYYGATVGKMVAKVKVIDFDHFGKVNLINSALRSAARIVSESIFYLGFIFAYYTQSRQTFHDKFGKTLVVDA